MPGESTIQPPPRSAGSRCSVECDVVCRPVASAADTSAVLAPASGASAFRIVDLPMPGLPDQHRVRAREPGQERRRVVLRRQRHDRVAEPRERLESLRSSAGKSGRSALFATSTNAQPSASAATVQRWTSSSSTGDPGRDDAADQRDVGGDQLFLERVGAVDERAARRDGFDRRRRLRRWRRRRGRRRRASSRVP